MFFFQCIYYIMSDIGIVVVILILIIVSVFIITKIENFNIKNELDREQANMENNTHKDFTEEDKYIECPNGASFGEVANSYHQCCQTNSNKAICEHPIFKKCKNDYHKLSKDKEYIKYFNNMNTYKMAKKSFKECSKTMEKSFSNYNNVKYKPAGNSKYSVTDLYGLSNKDNMSEMCKNMCNMWQEKCKAYKSDKRNCMLFSQIKKYVPILGKPNKDKLINGNNINIKI